MAKRDRHKWGRRWWPAVLLAALAGAGVPAVRAAATVVTCDGRDDIADIQAAVDAASDGDTIALRGTCDVGAAPPHGGGPAALAATAVLIRPGDPVHGLTITSADPDQPATIVGSGTQAAFTVAPGNDDVTIRGLRFVNLGRAVVAAGTTGTTVGAPGAAAPSPEGNVIVGGATMGSAVLGFARAGPLTVAYGTGGATVTFVPAHLAGFTVSANTIAYAPPGVPAAGANDVVGIDVRQAAGGTIDGVVVSGNAVGMFAADLPSPGQNAVRVEALDATAAPAPSRDDFAIRHVTVRDNRLGHLEQLDLSSSGVDTSRVHAAGRIGVLLERVGDFEVRDNLVRARLSAAGAGAPGGGLVVSDSAFGTVRANTVAVVADPGTSSADLGAIGVVDGLPALFGDARPDQRTTQVVVAGNQVGASGDGGPPSAQRGIVVSGPDLATVHGNDVATAGGPPLSIGAAVGVGASLARTVTRSVACSNVLNGSSDDPGAVSFTDGSPPSTANNFPGGAGAGAPGANAECTPTLELAPPVLRAGDDLVASGRGFASRPVDVVVTDELGAVRTGTTTADAAGHYSIVVDSAALSGLADGVLRVRATARDPSGLTRTSPPTTARKDVVADNPGAGTVAIHDGDGYTNANETLFGVGVSWRGPEAVATARAELWLSGSSGEVPPECGPFDVAPDGDATAGSSCLLELPDGPYQLHVQWEKTDGERTPEAVATSVKDTQVDVPTITAPAEGERVGTAVVTVAGSAEPGSTVTVRLAAPPRSVLGTATADGSGGWSVDIPFDDGPHQISAFAIDVAGNRSASSAPRRFTVDTSVPDTQPPAAPVIAAPADGALVPHSFAVGGSAEPGSTVTVFVGTFAVGTAPADGNGNWVSFVQLPEGVFALEATATDRAGNTSVRSAAVTVDVDAGPPGVVIDTPPDTAFLPGEPVVIKGRATDNREVFAVAVEYYDVRLQKVRDAAPAACTGCGTPSATWSSSPAPPLAPGVYFARVLVRDRAGNVSDAAVRFTTLSP